MNNNAREVDRCLRSVRLALQELARAVGHGAITHVLKHGVALCGAGAPLEWPGDNWASFKEPKGATCMRCIDAYMGMDEKELGKMKRREVVTFANDVASRALELGPLDMQANQWMQLGLRVSQIFMTKPFELPRETAADLCTTIVRAMLEEE